MVKVKKHSWLLLFLPFGAFSQPAETLTLQQAYDLAKQNYPAIRQKDLVRQTADLTISNLSKGNLPQLTINGQATYQSDVTKVEIPIPGFQFDSPAKDQYKATVDVSQLLYDGGTIKAQKTLQELNAGVEEEKVEVELYKVKERISQLYLGMLYLDEQLRQVALVREDLQSGATRVSAQVNNGVAFRSNLDVLKAEVLKTEQRAIELRASRKGMRETLSLFLNRPLPENLRLEPPVQAAGTQADTAISRPELALYSSQTSLLEQQHKLIRSKNLPRASLFVQGGYGRPGLNLLENKFDLFYIGGLRVNWALGGLYTRKKEKQLVKVSQQMVDVQRETFLLTTNTQLKQQASDIDKLEELIATDSAIIDLRKSVKDAARAQLENGVITANDYLREVNAEDQARQAKITHELQWLQAKINYQTISGKQ